MRELPKHLVAKRHSEGAGWACDSHAQEPLAYASRTGKCAICEHIWHRLMTLRLAQESDFLLVISRDYHRDTMLRYFFVNLYL